MLIDKVDVCTLGSNAWFRNLCLLYKVGATEDVYVGSGSCVGADLCMRAGAGVDVGLDLVLGTGDGVGVGSDVCLGVGGCLALLRSLVT